MSRKPDFFIVGAPKSGTTALYNYLKLHPDIFLSPLKEPNFFASDMPFKKLWYNNKIENYLSWFSEAKNEKRIGEASVCYLQSVKSAKEIKKFCPEASIIVMLRNPVDQMYSRYKDLVFWGSEDITDFEKALSAEKKRKTGKLSTRIINKKLLFYRDAANYYKHVKRYIDLFGIDKTHIIIFDEFKDNPNKILSDVLKFLEVDNTFKIDFHKFNTNRIINHNKKPRLLFVQKMINQRPELISKVIQAIFPRKVISTIAKYISRLNTKYEPATTMSPELREKLIKEFIPEIKKLSKLIKKELSFWYSNK
ncbi:MAG TPA: sulfotransferase [Patescibacteria group bacterium]|nr:sulfotransferase [Patescibacteria group bacterium]